MKLTKTYSRVATLIMVTLLLLILASCNPYKQLSGRPPLTAKDSAALLARCINIIPVDTSIKEKPAIIPQIPDSTGYYRGLADSLSKVKQSVKDSIAIRYKDSCNDAISIYEDGFNIGYKMGEYEGKSKSAEQYKKQIHLSDSICSEEINKVKRGYNIKFIAADNSVNIANKKSEQYRTRLDNWKTAFIWAAGLAALFLIICILLWKFRRQAKAANSVINTSKDIVDAVKS